MNEKRAELADRIRSLLSDEPTCEQKRMFGSLAFLVYGRIVAAAWGEGDLLVRVDPERSADLLLSDGVRQAEMGPRRKKMGLGWLDVPAEVVADDERLLFWIDAAREYAGLRGSA
ncbi:TfoX/Sxy family protein [Microbacterium sp. NIBRBAC000506063]|uniref:TfoX/Sxy family protein n=1 Tax=Microbacterium sp. NIBRBAC000506063 TaxID=2734618 RepID=UPI001CB7181B|nr:TfoX/Sxy family protein [Microbacterium sp. NIBRBAC000506063]